MKQGYMVYLKDSRMDELNRCVDACFFNSDDPEAAELIAQSRFQEQLKDGNLYLEIDTYASKPEVPIINWEDEE